MLFNDINVLKKFGCKGFLTINELIINPRQIPDESGIYFILYIKKEKPVFLEIGTGGYFKGKNPNVSIDLLKVNWIENSMVIYIGKTGSLNSRIRQLLRFGQGKNVGHYGGRLIWQIKDHQNLVVCWKTENSPKTVELELLNQFETTYGKLPFANLQRGSG